MSTMPDAPDSLFIQFQAALVGRYSLERELGRGGMGVVYLAREVRLDRPVAIKVLPPARSRDARLRDRFLREARTAAKLSHPNIIPIFAVDDVEEFVFFAMALVEGETLTERVRQRGPLPPSEAARVVREVAWALAYAHSQGVVHRDVKPDNIMIESGSGRALVADFGIAGLVKGATGVDGGEVIGTPDFMSPEQALGETVDARSDLYSLGLVGYFALTGKLPYAGGTATEILARQVTEAPPSFGDVGVPRKLGRAIERCLAKDPADRPQKGEDLAELAQTREERAVEGGHGPSAFERVLKWISAMGLGLPVLAILLGASGETIGTAFAVSWGAGLGKLVLMQRRRDVDGEFWGHVWMGRLGRWMFGVAKSFVPPGAAPAAMTHRPTELSIGMAVEQLFEGLPKETR